MPGPPPNRDSQRRRRNKQTTPAKKGKSGGGAERLLPGNTDKRGVFVPDPDPQWHKIARLYYDAFVQSGQVQWYEASDWATLFDVLDDLSVYKKDTHRSATKRMAMDHVLTRLLATEGDRRRMRIELDRGAAEGDADEDASLTVLSGHVQRFTG